VLGKKHGQAGTGTQVLRFVLRRIIQAALTLLGVLTASFFLVHLSGDPALLLLPPEASDADIARLRTELGLDQPVLLQYAQFLFRALQGDLGESLRQRSSALGLVLERLPATLELALTSFFLGIGLAFLLGLLLQMTESRRLRGFVLGLAFCRQAIPIFWFGLLAILLFSVTLRWLPSFGRGGLANLVLPALTLATYELGLYLRLFNAAFGRERGQDYVRTAHAKGQTRTRIITRHMLPNALLPLITVAGINLGMLLGGTVVTETVFSWPGAGRLLIQSVGQRDFPVVIACVVVIAALFVVINLLVDLLYGLLDPRVRVA
jgi:peptide/nickel transport system permease protein